MFKQNLSIRLLFLIFAVVFILVEAVFVYYHRVILVNREVERSVRTEAVEQATRLSNVLESFFLAGQGTQAESLISQVMSSRTLHRIFLVDSTDRIVFSSQYEAKHRQIEDLEPSSVPLIARSRVRSSPQQVLVERDSVLRTAYPVTMGIDPGNLRPNRIGAILMETSLVEAKRIANRQAIAEFLQIVGAMVFITLAGWVLMARMLQARISPLVRASNDMAQGDYSARTALQGPDELGRIGEAFDHMAAMIQVRDRTLTENEARYARAVKGTHDGIWDWDISTGDGYFSPRWLEILGYEEQDLAPHVDSFTNLIHPDDLARTGAAIESHLTHREPYDMEFRLRRKLGTYLWVRARGQAEWDEDGRPVRMAGSITDISAEKSAQEALRNSELRHRAIFETAVDGIITFDTEGRVEAMNPAAERLFGYAARELSDAGVSLLMPSPYREHIEDCLRNYRDSGDKTIVGTGREVEGRRKDTSVFPMDLSISEVVLGDRQLFTGILRDISERREAERMKSEFVATVSHELRTPLTSIRGSLGLLAGGATGELPVRSTRMIEIAMQNADRLVRLINDLLDMEKIVSGRLTMSLQPADLVAVISQSLLDNRGYADQLGVTFTFETALQSALTRGDPDRLNQVLTNLLSNAAKFSPQGGEVTVRLAAKDAGYLIEVVDRGPGIPEEFRERIFHRFSQADSSDTRQKGGTGLGLSISKAIVEMHGGTIGYESEMGRGTTFWFKLNAAAVITDAKGARFLVCVANPQTLDALRPVLAENGMAYDHAATSLEVRSRLSTHRYDAVVLDPDLPDGSPLAVIQELRGDGTMLRTPIIVISRQGAGQGIQLSGVTADIVDWLDKPIDPERMLASVQRARGDRDVGPQRVLHIEDDQSLSSYVALLLEDLARVDQVSTLSEARERLREFRYDLVVLDQMLPDGNGLELLPELTRPDGEPIPVLVFSATRLAEADLSRVTAALVKTEHNDSQLLGIVRGLIARARPNPGAG